MWLIVDCVKCEIFFSPPTSYFMPTGSMLKVASDGTRRQIDGFCSAAAAPLNVL